jgi:hypothetical protein
MIAGLDSSWDKPTPAQLVQARAHGVRMWSGYLATRAGVNIAAPWTQQDFDRVKAAGLSSIAFCSGKDDPVACKNRAAAWGVRLCLDVESGIRGDGPWVQDWLTRSGAGLYGNAPVFHGRRAAFYVLADYPGSDPHAAWNPHVPRPNGPCGWQWQGTHEEFGCTVDRGWYDDWFAGGGVHPPAPAPGAPPFPYPATEYLAVRGAGPHAHWGENPAEQANVRRWQTQMANRGWRIGATGTFDAASDQVCRKFQAEKGLAQDGKVGPATWAAAWTAPVT